MRRGTSQPTRRRIAASAIAGALLLVVSTTPAASLGGCTTGQPCPRATDDSYVMTLGSPLSVGAPGVLGNDVGMSGSSVDLETTDTTSWNNATVVVRSDGSFTYTPDPGDPFTGDDWFDYAIRDPLGGFAYGTTYVEVKPVVRDDTYSTVVNTTLSVPAPGLFGNDAGVDRSSIAPDSNSAKGGTVTVEDDGSFVFDPAPGYRGSDTFTYTVFDTENGASFLATVHIGIGVKAPTPGSTTPGPNDGSTHGTLPRNGEKPGTSPTTTAKSGGGVGGSSGSAGSASGTKPGGKGSKSTSSTAPADGKTPSTSKTSVKGVAGGAVAESDSGSGSSGAAIAGVIAVVLLAAAGAGAWMWVRRRRGVQGPPPGPTPGPTPA